VGVAAPGGDVFHAAEGAAGPQDATDLDQDLGGVGHRAEHERGDHAVDALVGQIGVLGDPVVSAPRPSGSDRLMRSRKLSVVGTGGRGTPHGRKLAARQGDWCRRRLGLPWTWMIRARGRRVLRQQRRRLIVVGCLLSFISKTGARWGRPVTPVPEHRAATAGVDGRPRRGPGRL
jgi:hypothetical protein